SLAAAHDYQKFVVGELAHRRQFDYPPFQRLARVLVRSRRQEDAAAFAERLLVAFQGALDRLKTPEGGKLPVRLLGPAEAPVFRLKNYYRFHFQLQSTSPAVLHQVLRAVLPTVRCPSGVEITVDVDALNML